MGCCLSTHTTDDTTGPATREVVPELEKRPPPVPQGTETSGPSRCESPQVEEVPMPARHRAKSTPRKAPSMMEDLTQGPSQRARAKSFAPSPRGTSSPMSADAEHSRASPRRPTISSPSPSRRPLTSTVQQVLPENVKFRILVLGKRGSGKSSLIKAVFKVDVTATPERALGKADIDIEFRPEDNRYLIVHECSGLDSQTKDSQDLQNIRDFISRRTDPSCSLLEKLHVIWMCVQASDIIDGRLEDGVEEILGMRNVPVILVFTKFDIVVSQVLFDIAGGDAQRHERARAKAHMMYEDSCRRLFHKGPSEVPAEIVSENPRFIDLIDNLVVTTDRFITDSRAQSTRDGVHGAKQRIGALPLAWSAALRVNHDIIIQASIEVGRSGYWRSLWSSLDFADQPLKKCVNIIHVDIVKIWNLNDKKKYLSSDEFKAKMSHLVKDLAGSANTTSGSDRTRAVDKYANWVHDSYRGSRENVRCVVGYIVDLTVILDGTFRMAAGDMSPDHVLQVADRHASSGHKDAIHRDIRSFIAEAFALRFPVQQMDLVLEKIIDLIKQYCVPPSY